MTTYICATQCTKIYHLPETCSKITTTAATTTRTTTTKQTTIATTRATTRSTTRRTTTEETLPTIRPVTDSLDKVVYPYVPTACSWKGAEIQIGLYKMIDNCEYVQCLRDFILSKPFLHYKAGFRIAISRLLSGQTSYLNVIANCPRDQSWKSFKDNLPKQ